MPTDRPIDTQRRSREWAAYALIVLAGLAVRIYLTAAADTVSRDTCTFVWFAQDLAADGIQAVDNYQQHPLYPASILATHTLLDSVGLAPAGNAGWRVAAILVALLAGLACIVVIGLLARFLFGRTVGLVCAGFAAVLPELAEYSADGLSDTLHLLLYVSALLLGMVGLTRSRWQPMLAAGVLSGLAFLTRPEGAGVAVVLTMACLALPRVGRWRTRLPMCAAVAVGALLVAAPYMQMTGRLIPKKSIFELFGQPAGQTAGASDAPSAIGAHWPILADAGLGLPAVASAVVLIVRKWVRTCRVVFFVLAILGICQRGWPADRRNACAALTAAGALHFAVLMLLVVNFAYDSELSQRHTLVLAVLILPWAAAALNDIVAAVLKRRPAAAPALVWTVAIAIIVGSIAYWLFRPRQQNTRYMREAAVWLAEHRPDTRLVMTAEYRVGFYADKRIKRWPAERADVHELVQHIDDYSPDILALDVHRVTRTDPDFVVKLLADTGAQMRLQELKTFRAPGDAGDTHQIILFDAFPNPPPLRKP